MMREEYMRLDSAAVSRGLASSRSRAQSLIKSGKILVNGKAVLKPSATVRPLDKLQTAETDGYVSRGAYKLAGALEEFCAKGLKKPRNRLCLDIGASAGGFTDVLLREGAKKVIALDVGHGQLNARIASDPRVIEMSGVNIRDVEPCELPFIPDFAVSDVSFISLTYVIPHIARIAAVFSASANNAGENEKNEETGKSIETGETGENAVKTGEMTAVKNCGDKNDFDCILLIKPQFEVGKGNLGKNGIVTDENKRARAVEKVLQCARDCGFEVRGLADSAIEGMHGNKEFVLWISM